MVVILLLLFAGPGNRANPMGMVEETDKALGSHPEMFCEIIYVPRTEMTGTKMLLAAR